MSVPNIIKKNLALSGSQRRVLEKFWARGITPLHFFPLIKSNNMQPDPIDIFTRRIMKCASIILKIGSISEAALSGKGLSIVPILSMDKLLSKMIAREKGRYLYTFAGINFEGYWEYYHNQQPHTVKPRRNSRREVLRRKRSIPRK